MGQMRQFMGWVKDLGATIVRAHIPLNPELEQMADQDGILLWSEVPVYQISKSNLAECRGGRVPWPCSAPTS